MLFQNTNYLYHKSKKIKVRITSTKINILKIPRIFYFSSS